MASMLSEILAGTPGLVARRRELKGELTRLAADISAIDRVTRMLDPDHQPKAEPSGVRPSPGFTRGAS